MSIESPRDLGVVHFSKFSLDAISACEGFVCQGDILKVAETVEKKVADALSLGANVYYLLQPDDTKENCYDFLSESRGVVHVPDFDKPLSQEIAFKKMLIEGGSRPIDLVGWARTGFVRSVSILLNGLDPEIFGLRTENPRQYVNDAAEFYNSVNQGALKLEALEDEDTDKHYQDLQNIFKSQIPAKVDIEATWDVKDWPEKLRY